MKKLFLSALLALSACGSATSASVSDAWAFQYSNGFCGIANSDQSTIILVDHEALWINVNGTDLDIGDEVAIYFPHMDHLYKSVPVEGKDFADENIALFKWNDNTSTFFDDLGKSKEMIVISSGGKINRVKLPSNSSELADDMTICNINKLQ